MTDQEILDRIHALMDEEHQLAQSNAGSAGHDVTAQLTGIDVEIDRQWDLLRQRRALRRAGEDPDTAVLRPAQEVEGYQQ